MDSRLPCMLNNSCEIMLCATPCFCRRERRGRKMALRTGLYHPHRQDNNLCVQCSQRRRHIVHSTTETTLHKLSHNNQATVLYTQTQHTRQKKQKEQKDVWVELRMPIHFSSFFCTHTHKQTQGNKKYYRIVMSRLFKLSWRRSHVMDKAV